jgi:hypothetical protein
MTKIVKCRVIDSFQAEEAVEYRTEREPDKSAPRQSIVHSQRCCRGSGRTGRGTIHTGSRKNQSDGFVVSRGIPLGLVVDFLA